MRAEWGQQWDAFRNESVAQGSGNPYFVAMCVGNANLPQALVAKDKLTWRRLPLPPQDCPPEAHVPFLRYSYPAHGPPTEIPFLWRVVFT